MNGFGINPGAVAYAIKQARASYDPADWSIPEGCDMVHAALDKLAEDLAIQLHPDQRNDFLARCGTQEQTNG